MYYRRYITANSCSPPGYADYFGSNPDLSNEWWSPTIPDCQLPYPQDGTRSGVWPEQFWNCAEGKACLWETMNACNKQLFLIASVKSFSSISVHSWTRRHLGPGYSHSLTYPCSHAVSRRMLLGRLQELRHKLGHRCFHVCFARISVVE